MTTLAPVSPLTSLQPIAAKRTAKPESDNAPASMGFLFVTFGMVMLTWVVAAALAYATHKQML
jgi:hypothetical protein